MGLHYFADTWKQRWSEWTAEDMERAFSAMKRRDMGLNAAAKSYGVPKATLSRHQKSTNLFANGSVKFHGRSCVLTQSIEEELVMRCLQLESMELMRTLTHSLVLYWIHCLGLVSISTCLEVSATKELQLCLELVLSL